MLMNLKNKKIIDAVLLSVNDGTFNVKCEDRDTTIRFNELVSYIDHCAQQEHISFYDSWENIVHWKQFDYDQCAVLTGIIDDDD